MDRSAFLGTLPFLHKINPLSLSRLRQHHKLILKASLFSEEDHHHHHHYHHHHHHHHHDSDDGNDDITSKEALTETKKKVNESVDLNFPHGVLFTKHVTSIEPIGYHNGQSIGPAFFSAVKLTPPTVSVLPVDKEQVAGSNDDKQDASEELDEDNSPLPHDPALCRFRAALIPAYLPRLSSDGNMNHAYVENEVRNTLKNQSHLTSPASSSASTYMTATPSQTSPQKLNTNTQATNMRKDVISEGDPTYVLYFWFGDQVYCVDHGQICSIHMEPASQASKLPPSDKRESIIHPTNNDSHEDRESRQTVVQPAKPPSLVITFESCSFRIFEQPPSPSKTMTNTATSGLMTKDERLQQEKYLENKFIKLRHFLSFSPTSLSSPLFGTNSHVSFDEYFLHLHSGIPTSADKILGGSSSSVPQSSEESIHHENGQVTSGPAVDKLLFQDRLDVSQGGSEEKDEEENRNCGKNDLSSSTMGDKKCVKTELKNRDTHVILDGVKKHKHVQMKRKLDSYQKSWYALQSIHSVMNPTTTGERRRRRYKGEGDDVSSMMTTCAEGLCESYYGSLKIASVVDDGMENQEDEELLSSRQADEEVLKEKLSCVQQELDNAIRLIFPAPMNRSAKKPRFAAAAKVTSTGVLKYGNRDNGHDVNDLKQEIEKCLRNHRETVMQRHSLAFLPVRHADASANEDV